MQSARSGFTLVELLVTIAIVALLAGLTIILYTSVQSRARDSDKKSDLQAISQALELYYQTNKKYPGTVGQWYLSGGSDPWIPGLDSNYISPPLPVNILGNTGNPTIGGTAYAYRTATVGSNECGNGGDQYFVLVALLENSKDSDRLGVKNVIWCGKSLRDDPAYFWFSKTYVLTNP